MYFPAEKRIFLQKMNFPAEKCGFRGGTGRKPQELQEGFRAQESRTLANLHKIFLQGKSEILGVGVLSPLERQRPPT